MKFLTRKTIAVWLAATVAALLLLSAGFYLGKTQQQTLRAQTLVINVSDSVGALLLLERSQHDRARDFLIGSVESDLIELSLLESVELDHGSNDVRGQALHRFAELRRRWPSDRPEKYRNVDEAIDAYIARYQTPRDATHGLPASR